MNKILYKILVFLPCLLVLCSSCTDDSDRLWYQDVEALESCYLAAVRDAEEALPREICRTLPAIVSPDSLDDPRQQWMVSADGKAFCSGRFDDVGCRSGGVSRTVRRAFYDGRTDAVGDAAL